MKFLRREFACFWNVLPAEWSVFWSLRKRRCDNERDFWNMESSCDEVFRHSRMGIPELVLKFVIWSFVLMLSPANPPPLAIQ
jgi:hypothetical protein